MVKFTGPAWRLAGNIADRFHMEKWGRQDSWVAVLFHHITDGLKWRADDPLVHGLNIDIALDAFNERIRWLIDRYEVVPLDSIIGPDPTPTSRPRLLICFDDGYASVPELAAPILRKLNVPWCFFINARFVGNVTLPVDNIVAFISNVHGSGPLSEVAGKPISGAPEFIRDYLSQMSPLKRQEVIQTLASKLSIDTEALARASRLFVDDLQIRELARSGVEIGNHTFEHVHCRGLDTQSAVVQIEEHARAVETLSGRPVRAFAYPYGALRDATEVARAAVQKAGHECAFVVQNRRNTRWTDKYALYRVDLGEMDNARAALELEVLPRIRAAVGEVRTRIYSMTRRPRIVVLTGSDLQHRYVASVLAELPGVASIVETEQPAVSIWKRIQRAIKRFGFMGMVSRALLKLTLKLTGEAARRKADLKRVLDDPKLPNGVPVVRTIGVNSTQTQKILRDLAPDILCVYGTYIVSNATLSIASRVALNLHTGISPRYRGADCDFWALYNRELNFIGATVHECTANLDGGAIFGTATASLDPGDSLGAVFGRCVIVGSTLYKRIVADLFDGRAINSAPQDLFKGKEYKAALRGWRAEFRVAWLISNGLIRDYAKSQARNHDADVK